MICVANNNALFVVDICDVFFSLQYVYFSLIFGLEW
uniref:Uncharacterized protein n=1 Tax=Ascaris lumbricoides TaxID=6252 RepID=A0A0M3HJ30_ASCLU